MHAFSQLDASMKQNQRLIATTLAAALDEVWSAEGESRVRDLVRRADAAKSELDVRWVRQGEDEVRLTGVKSPFDAVSTTPFEVVQRIATTGDGNGRQERLLTYVSLPDHESVAAALEVSEPTAPRRQYVRAAVIEALLSSLAARILGVDRKTLYRRLSSYGDSAE